MHTSTKHTQSPHSEDAKISKKNPTLLYAISKQERDLFLKNNKQEFSTSPVDIVWLDTPEALTESLLREISPDIILTCWSTPPLPESWLEADDCPLRYLCHLAGSVKNIVPRSFIKRGGIVSNWGRLAAEPVAEHALLLALAALRNLGMWSEVIGHTTAGQESLQLGTRSLIGRRVGIHGFGAVAQSLVRLLKPFRVHVQAYSKDVPETIFKKSGVKSCASLEELFAQSEVLFECEALSPATEGSVNANILAALPDEALFVNVARGLLVDEAALLQEASSGRIRLALDVVCHEPLSPNAPLYLLKQAILSPHIGGPTLDLYPKFGDFAQANILRFLRGELPVAQVTPEIYDRST